MQEGKTEWVTSLLFFHFVRISTPQTPKTDEENARCQQLARACGRAVAGRAGASGTVFHARREAGGLGPAEETLCLCAGGAAGGPGKGSGVRGAAARRSRLAREGAAGRPPRPTQS